MSADDEGSLLLLAALVFGSIVIFPAVVAICGLRASWRWLAQPSGGPASSRTHGEQYPCRAEQIDGPLKAEFDKHGKDA